MAVSTKLPPRALRVSHQTRVYAAYDLRAAPETDAGRQPRLGVVEVAPKPPPRNPFLYPETVLTSVEPGEPSIFIVRQSNELSARRQDACAFPLYRRFADCRKANDFLAFVREFGFVSDPDAKIEPLSMYLNSAEVMRWLIKVAELDGQRPDGWRELRQKFGEHKSAVRVSWFWLSDWLEENQNAIRVTAKLQEADDNARHVVFFQPKNLLGAMYLRLIQDATETPEIRKCKNPACPNYFYIERPRRSTGEYCSPRCGSQFRSHNYLMRQKRGKRGEHAR